MKHRRLLFTILVVLACFQFGFGQKKSVVVYSISAIYPEQFGVTLSHTKNLIDENKNSMIYAVIHPKKNDLRQAWIAEGFTNGAIEFASIKANEIRVIRGEPREEFSVDLWLITQNAEKPNIAETDWNFSLSRDAKSFVVFDWGFGTTNSFSGYERIFSDFLIANPTAVGQVRIFAKTIKQFVKEKEDIFAKLPNVQKRQLRFIWKRDDSSSGAFEWKIIPNRLK